MTAYGRSVVVPGRDFIVDEIGEPVALVLKGKERLVRRFIVTYFIETTNALRAQLTPILGNVEAATSLLKTELGADLLEKLRNELPGAIGYQTRDKAGLGRDLVSVIGIVPFELSPASFAITFSVTRIDDPPPHP